MDPKIKELISLTTRMRTLQKNLNANPRNARILAQTRELEKAVDEKLNEIQHGQLF